MEASMLLVGGQDLVSRCFCAYLGFHGATPLDPAPMPMRQGAQSMAGGEPMSDEKASTLIDRTLSDAEDSGIEVLKWQDAAAIASLIGDEHPQVISVILTRLDAEKAAEVMQELTETQRTQIMPRIATMRSISPQALHELDVVIEEGAKEIRSFKPLPTTGTRSAADILNFMNSELEQTLMDELRQFDDKLAEKVEEYMFPFGRLVDIDKRGLQTLLREINNETMVLALKGADETLQKMFFTNMSERAADMLKDDLETKGPVQLNKVEGAQKEIVAIAQRMAKEGKIVIAGSSYPTLSRFEAIFNPNRG